MYLDRIKRKHIYNARRYERISYSGELQEYLEDRGQEERTDRERRKTGKWPREINKARL